MVMQKYRHATKATAVAAFRKIVGRLLLYKHHLHQVKDIDYVSNKG